MLISVPKELQTSTSSTTAYGMTIRSMSSRTSPAPISLLDNPSDSLDAVSRIHSRLEGPIADCTTPLDSIRPMFLIRIKCLIGPSK